VPISARFPSGLPKLTLLNALKNSALNSIASRSVILVFLIAARSASKYLGPRRIFFPVSPKVSIAFGTKSVRIKPLRNFRSMGTAAAQDGFLDSVIRCEIGAITQHAAQRIVRATEDGEWSSSFPDRGRGKFPPIHNLVKQPRQNRTRGTRYSPLILKVFERSSSEGP